MPNKQSFISTTTDLDSITYKLDPETKAIIQQIWEKDSLYEYPISMIDSTQFETFELPEGIIIKDGIGDWSEMRITKDGLCMLQKFYEDSEVPERLVMFGKGENGDTLSASITYKPDGNPKYFCFNDFFILVDSVYNDSIDFTLVCNDSIAFVYKKTSFGTEAFARGMVPMRNYAQMDWCARITAISQVILGIGEAMLLPEMAIIGFYASKASFSLGPVIGGYVSVFMALSLYSAAISACNNINIGLRKLYEIDYWPDYNNNIFVPLSLEGISFVVSRYALGLGKSIVSGSNMIEWLELTLEEELGSLFIDKSKYSKFTNYFTIIGDELVKRSDEHYGHIYTLNDKKIMYEKGLTTGGVIKKNRQRVVVTAFVSPTIVRDPVDEDMIDCEYGIIVYKEGKAEHIKRWFYDEAELLLGHLEADLNGLEPETTYEYQAYFYNKENGLRLFGEMRSFKMESLAIPEIESFEVLDATYSEEGYPYGEETYHYKFDCAMTVQMEATEGMEDYGYIYKGVDGNESLVSLKGQQFPYTDDNYVYYRKRSYSTTSFCGYVKYYNDDNIYKGKWQTYDLAYGKHPTPGKMIDLGLSVKWAAYNVGAEYPEETGNLYAWGEIETKEEYIWQTYKYKYGGAVIYCDNLGDISGNPKYDAARSSWGYGWCIPHSYEVQELVTRCKKEDMTYEGVNGMLFTGPNGNSIFVPKMSYWLPLGISANYTGQTACTWFPFTSEFMATNGGSNKCVGLPIRAVYK